MKKIYLILLSFFIFETICFAGNTAFYTVPLSTTTLSGTYVQKSGDTILNLTATYGIVSSTITVSTITAYAVNTSSLTVVGVGNSVVGSTDSALATSLFTVYNGDIQISTTTGSRGIYFQDNSLQVRAYTPVFVSSQNVSSAINIASTSDIYVSTISITQIGGKNIGIIGSLEFTSDATKTHTISLYRDSTLLQSWTHNIGTNDDEPLPIMYFKDMSSTAGTVVYTIRVRSSAATGTQTVANYNWRVRED